MTETLDAPIATIVETLDAIEDHAEHYQATQIANKKWDDAMRVVRQRRALRMRDEGKTWREIGEVMGGVSPQRAEQISRSA